MLFQLDTVTHMHTILISRFQVHPTEVNLKELSQTKLEGEPGSEQYCFMSLFSNWVAEFTSTQGSLSQTWTLISSKWYV